MNAFFEFLKTFGWVWFLNIQGLKNDYSNLSKNESELTFSDYTGSIAVHESGHAATLGHSGLHDWYGSYKVNESIGIYGHGDERQYTFMGIPDMFNYLKGITFKSIMSTMTDSQRKVWSKRFNGKPKNNAKKIRRNKRK